MHFRAAGPRKHARVLICTHCDPQCCKKPRWSARSCPQTSASRALISFIRLAKRASQRDLKFPLQNEYRSASHPANPSFSSISPFVYGKRILGQAKENASDVDGKLTAGRPSYRRGQRKRSIAFFLFFFFLSFCFFLYFLACCIAGHERKLTSPSKPAVRTVISTGTPTLWSHSDQHKDTSRSYYIAHSVFRGLAVAYCRNAKRI